MNYGRRTPSVGTPSVYSHVTSRSTANLRSSRSLKSLKIPWYRRPIVQDAYFLDIQRGSLLFAFYSLVSFFIISQSEKLQERRIFQLKIFLVWNKILHYNCHSWIISLTLQSSSEIFILRNNIEQLKIEIMSTSNFILWGW